MSNPYYNSPTYTPMSEQQPQQQQQQSNQNPYMNAYGAIPGMGGGGAAAQTLNLGVMPGTQDFGQRDQSYMPGLEKNYDDASKWGIQNNVFGSGYNTGMMDNYQLYNLKDRQGGGGLGESPNERSISYSTFLPTANMKTNFTNFEDANKYYTDYFNMTKGLMNNGFNQIKDLAHSWYDQNTLFDPGPGNAKYGEIEGQLNSYQNALKQRQQDAMNQYLSIYNDYGRRGAFGLGFKDRTNPFTF